MTAEEAEDRYHRFSNALDLEVARLFAGTDLDVDDIKEAFRDRLYDILVPDDQADDEPTAQDVWSEWEKTAQEAGYDLASVLAEFDQETKPDDILLDAIEDDGLKAEFQEFLNVKFGGLQPPDPPTFGLYRPADDQ